MELKHIIDVLHEHRRREDEEEFCPPLPAEVRKVRSLLRQLSEGIILSDEFFTAIGEDHSFEYLDVFNGLEIVAPRELWWHGISNATRKAHRACFKRYDQQYPDLLDHGWAVTYDLQKVVVVPGFANGIWTLAEIRCSDHYVQNEEIIEDSPVPWEIVDQVADRMHQYLVRQGDA